METLREDYFTTVENFVNIAKESLGSYESWADNSKLSDEETKAFESFIYSLHITAFNNYRIVLPFPETTILSNPSGTKTINLKYGSDENMMLIELDIMNKKIKVAAVDEMKGYMNATMGFDYPRLGAFLFLYT